MDEYDFGELCRQAAYLLNLDDADALHVSGASVDGEMVGVIFMGEFDDGVLVYVDLGTPPEASAEPEMLRELLDINLELSARNGESFGFHRESGHLVLRSFFHFATLTPQYLADGIRDYVAFVQEMRTGPLATLSRPAAI